MKIQPANALGPQFSRQQTLIVEQLQSIQMKGGDGNFIVFIVNPQANYYVQVAMLAEPALLYAEAVGNNFIPAQHQLTHDQHERLLILGWQPPVSRGMNYIYEELVTTAAERDQFAGFIMQTLVDVYALHAEQEIGVELNLE